MGKGRKHKIETVVPQAELSALLENLGKGLAEGFLRLADGGQDTNVTGYEGLKLSIKPREDGAAIVKIKVKLSKAGESGCGCEAADDDCDDDEDGEGSCDTSEDHQEESPDGCIADRAEDDAYKPLKKRMKKPWKELLAALEAGQQPASQTAQCFIADARQMLAFAGKGNEDCPDFEPALLRLESALAVGAIAEARTAASELDTIKKQCHDRLK